MFDIHTAIPLVEKAVLPYPNADLVVNLVVFNIGGNKYRLIASIHFNQAKVYIRHVLTHQQYDKGA